jgi:hypothetical protein
MPFGVSMSNRERPLGAGESPFDELRANEETYVTVITSRSTKEWTASGVTADSFPHYAARTETVRAGEIA